MERTELPIAVFDSGLGGISVLRALVQRLPGEDFLYFGDSANAPYGVRPVAEVRRLTQDVIGRLYDRGIKAAVIACNTATSAAIGPLRAAFPDIPVIGIEPALKPAVAHHRRVLVLATPLTLREEKFVALMHQCAGCAEIVPLPCPELVEFVERGELDSPALTAYLARQLGPYAGRVDAAVLGCTHFPFARRAIRAALGGNVTLYDGSDGTARETLRQLVRRGWVRGGSHGAAITPAYLQRHLDVLNSAAAVVLDGNLTAETITWLGTHCSAPLFADPVSVTKAERMRAALGALHTFKPNLTEGQNLTGESTPEGIVAALLAQGVQRVFLSMGADGILAGTRAELVHLPCLPTCMVNTTGGGDAVMAALVWAYLQGLDLRESAAAALRAGKATVEYPGTNNPDLGALVHG